jgi:hypothetical protein
MKRTITILTTIAILLAVAIPASASTLLAAVYTGFPTFSIESVTQDQSVTIKTSNLPPNDTFTVTMGKIGTKGIDGVVVGTTDSGTGGSQTFTYNIPASLKGSGEIAIRMQSPTSGYFAYNWFINSTAAGPSTPQPTPTTPPSTGYSGFPTFSIESVVQDKSVTIKTSNLPSNDTFTVTMGKMGTKGVGGVEVASSNSGTGGTQTFTYNIPASLAGLSEIAIRMQSPTSGYFAYNWFFNAPATGTSSPQPTPTGTPAPSGYTGFPTFSIESVVQDKSVTIKTANLPANETFIVTMGKMGTQGIDGIEVGTSNSATGGAQTFTYNIPANLAGLSQIAIRMESPTSGYFAYNWFYNTTP